MNRIEKLREEALLKTLNNNELQYLYFKRIYSSQIENEYDRYADAYYFAFSNLRPQISDGELIVGKAGDSLSDL